MKTENGGGGNIWLILGSIVNAIIVVLAGDMAFWILRFVAYLEMLFVSLSGSMKKKLSERKLVRYAQP